MIITKYNHSIEFYRSEGRTFYISADLPGLLAGVLIVYILNLRGFFDRTFYIQSPGCLYIFDIRFGHLYPKIEIIMIASFEEGCK